MENSSILSSPFETMQNEILTPSRVSPKWANLTKTPSRGVGLPQLRSEDVAIVGMACRTAGGNDSPEKLWQFLLDKKDASGEVPQHRWEPWLRRDARNVKEIEKTISKGYFIQTLENFDASFFGISPKEAEQMDPHQRLGLELSWEALEASGIDPKSLAGSDTAVFMGIDSDDYSRLLLEDMPNIEAWMGIGTAAHGVPNRISYHLDLMGPSTAVDAACASSLVAVHMGCRAILNGESQVAIVGGVNVLLAPALTLMLGKAGALSSEGICRCFDDDANGYARGEGGAVLILKKLSSAIIDGDNILATLKGSAIAQDGKTNGIMAPNAKAQELVGRQALARAGIDPLTVGFVEAHATSTPLGDPTEISAISAIYGAGAGRPKDAPVHVGSIKPNVGHLEAASGAIGLIKAVLAVKKGQLAPQARLNKLNSRVDWDNSGVQVVRETMDWHNPDGPRRAAVCSYGYGGTVSHAVIEEFTGNGDSSEQGHDDTWPVILTISSAQEKRLGPQASALAQWLSTPSGKSSKLRAIANTLAQRRAHNDCRVAFVAESHDEAISALQQFATGGATTAVPVFQRRTLKASPSPVWVFSGHGAQWKQMGKELLVDPVFCRAVSSLDSIVQREAGFSAVEALANSEFESPERVQILTYLVQMGLKQVLQSKGVEPRAIIGHSVGEIAATVVAGCLTAEEGVLIVTRRAKLYAQFRDKCPGGMALVNLSFALVRAKLGCRRDLVAAIDSSPTTCVVSGMVEAVDDFMAEMAASDIRTFRIKTDVAFHSPMLEEFSGPLRDALAGTLRPRRPRIPLYSTSNIDPRCSTLRCVDYWVNNMISPVHLSGAVRAAMEDSHRIFVEISSHPVVLHSIHETLVERGLDDDECATIPTMKRDEPAPKAIQSAISQLYISGSDVDFESQFGHKSVWCQSVPGTQWMHRPYYKEVEAGTLGDRATHDMDKHTLLGQRTVVAGTDTILYATKLDDKTKPFPGTHPLDGTEIIPAAVYINTFHHATGATVLQDIKLRVPVSMSQETRNVQIVVRKDGVSIASSSMPQSGTSQDGLEQTWVSHSSCKWTRLPLLGESTGQRLDIASIKKRVGTVLPNSFAVDYLAKIGVAGVAFPWQVTEHYGNIKEMVARVDMDPSVEKTTWDEHSWAPLLDAATSVGSTIFFSDPKLRIVSQIDRVTLFSGGPLPKIGYLYIEKAADATGPASHVSVLDDQGKMLAKFDSMRFSEVEGASGISGSADSLVHRIAWVPPKFSETPRTLSQVVMVSNDARILCAYSQQLEWATTKTYTFESAQDLEDDAESDVPSALRQPGAAIVYIPSSVESLQAVFSATEGFLWQTASLVKFIERNSLSSTCKLFVVTNRACAGESVTALAHGSLYGLARIIASEHPDLWGGLLDTDNPGQFPMLAAKYVQGQDVVRIVDGLPRRAMMRPLLVDQRHEIGTTQTLLPKPGGTYVITGGFGGFGLETCSFLVEKGACRLVVVSRGALPPRHQWRQLASSNPRLAVVIQRVQDLERLGATIHSLALDISAPDALQTLLAALDSLGLPPVLGVVHAAGVLEDSLLLDTTRESFARVLAPKVGGALALHQAFPPASLDFFVLYSSIGQLVGTAGQASYGSGNTFLDAMATHRRAKGDNAVAFQFTALRGIGMATSTGFLTVELQSKGITDISSDEAFCAWEHIGKYDVDGAVITRCLPINEGTVSPLPLMEGVVVTRPKPVSDPADAEMANGATDSRPADPQELEKWLNVKIRESIATVLLMTDVDDIDPRMPLADLGVDSVMTVALRQRLQTALKVKVPPTLTWNHPTVNHLVPWFMAKFREE